MEYLIKRGIPQRTAHHAVGRLVRIAMERSARLADLSLEEFQEHVDDNLTDEVYSVLGVENALNAFTSFGSTAPKDVEFQVRRWKEKLKL